MAFDIDRARSFVASVDLAGMPRGVLAPSETPEVGAVFDRAKAQAQVVGSGVFSFAQGVDAAMREAISDSALLAQLVANKRASAEQAPLAWFAAYSEVLQNVGWTLQESGWNDYSATGTAGEVNEKIVEVLALVLGPGASALALVMSTINALKGMNPDSSWIKIFSRETQKARLARFQIGLVEKANGGDTFVSLLACLVEAQSSITQVLFFKFKDANASFKANSAKVSINRAASTDLGPAIRAKVRAFQADFLSSITDL